VHGRLIFLAADNINTDAIYGKDYTYRDDMTPEMMAKVIMENYDPQLAASTRAGDVFVGGFNFGTGSSRDWAAKGTQLLGVKAVIAKSFERIHRSNLVGMGVLPCQFKGSDTVASLGIKGDEEFDIFGIDGAIKPQQDVTLVIKRKDGSRREVQVLLRIDTAIEVDYYRHGGIMPYVLRELLAAA